MTSALSHEEVAQRLRDELLEHNCCGLCLGPVSSAARLVVYRCPNGKARAALVCTACTGPGCSERFARRVAAGTVGRASPSLLAVAARTPPGGSA